MNKRNIIFLLLAAVVSFGALAQGHKNLRITEVMVAQDSTQYGGTTAGWVELYNSSYQAYAIEKMFITDKRPDQIFTKANEDIAYQREQVRGRDAVLRYLSEDPLKTGVYMIPRGDERNTNLGEHGQCVFVADGQIQNGTFHLPFKFADGRENYIAVYDVNGDLVDELTIPASLKASQSYALKAEGRLPIEGAEHNGDFEMRDGSSIEKAITPGNFNTRIKNENIEKFHQHDPYGVIITIIAMLIVFSALILLFLLFKLFGYVSDKSLNKNAAPAAPQAVEPQVSSAATAPEAGEEEIAAICMALYQHFNAHDEESGVLTFKHNTATAWNSKEQMMCPTPQRK